MGLFDGGDHLAGDRAASGPAARERCRSLLVELLAPADGVRAAAWADALIDRFGSFSGAISARESDQRELVGPAGVAALARFRGAMLHALRTEIDDRPLLGSLSKLTDYLKLKIAHLKQEQVRAIYIDSADRMIADELIADGSIDRVSVSPRQILARALALEARAVILVHNHPSDDPSPSRVDLALTRTLRMAAEALGVTILDHLIIARSGHFSFRAMEGW